MKGRTSTMLQKRSKGRRRMQNQFLARQPEQWRTPHAWRMSCCPVCTTYSSRLQRQRVSWLPSTQALLASMAACTISGQPLHHQGAGRLALHQVQQRRPSFLVAAAAVSAISASHMAWGLGCWQRRRWRCCTCGHSSVQVRGVGSSRPLHCWHTQHAISGLPSKFDVTSMRQVCVLIALCFQRFFSVTAVTVSGKEDSVGTWCWPGASVACCWQEALWCGYGVVFKHHMLRQAAVGRTTRYPCLRLRSA